MGLGVAGLAGSLGSAQVLGSLQGLGTPQTRVGPGRCFPRPQGPSVSQDFPLLVIPWPGSQPCPLGTTPQAH